MISKTSKSHDGIRIFVENMMRNLSTAKNLYFRLLEHPYQVNKYNLNSNECNSIYKMKNKYMLSKAIFLFSLHKNT